MKCLAAGRAQGTDEHPMTNNRTDILAVLGLLVAYGWYMRDVIPDGLTDPSLLGRTIGFFVAVTVAMILTQIVIALVPKGGDPDPEVEREIGRRSGRNAYIAVLSVLWAIPFLAAIPEIGVNLAIVSAVGAMGLAEVVRYGSRIVYRGLGSGRNQPAVAA